MRGAAVSVCWVRWRLSPSGVVLVDVEWRAAWRVLGVHGPVEYHVTLNGRWIRELIRNG